MRISHSKRFHSHTRFSPSSLFALSVMGSVLAVVLDGLALRAIVQVSSGYVSNDAYELFPQLPLLASASFALSIAILILPGRLGLVRFFLSAVKTFVVTLILAIIDIGTTPTSAVLIAWLVVVVLREDVSGTIFIESIFVAVFLVFAVSFRESGIFGSLETSGILALFASLLVLFAAPIVIKVLINEIEKKDTVAKVAQEEMAAITEASAGLLSYSATIEEHSRQMERERIAREIHDSAGYALTTLRMTFEAAKGVFRKSDYGHMEQLLDEGVAIAKEALQDMRASMRDLKEEGVPAPQGIPMVLRLIRNFQNVTGIAVESEFLSTQRSYGPEIDSTVFRMVQEGLTNAFRHGRATKIHVIMTEMQGKLNVTIIDNGRAEGDVEIGIGLAGMDERIRDLRGTMSFGYLKPGFQVSASVPLDGSHGKHD